MLNLVEPFMAIEEKKYCIVKISTDFPLYSDGSDIDIFCLDPQDIARDILSWGNKYVSEEMGIEISDETDHCVVDFVKKSKIHFRFDLYGSLPHYKKLRIRPSLYESIIENSVGFGVDSGSCMVKVPCLLDDMIIRYFEFIEWYNVRPDKVKHLDYVIDQLSPDLRRDFFDRIHYYTEVPRSYEGLKPRTGNGFSLRKLEKRVRKLFRRQ